MRSSLVYVLLLPLLFLWACGPESYLFHPQESKNSAAVDLPVRALSPIERSFVEYWKNIKVQYAAALKGKCQALSADSFSADSANPYHFLLAGASVVQMPYADSTGPVQDPTARVVTLYQTADTRFYILLKGGAADSPADYCGPFQRLATSMVRAGNSDWVFRPKR